MRTFFKSHKNVMKSFLKIKTFKSLKEVIQLKCDCVCRPRSEKFNIVSNDHGRTQKCDFCVSVYKTNFTDHHTPDTIHGFSDSILVCKTRDCYCTVRKNIELFHSFPSRYQGMHAIAIVRPYENKPLQNAFKRI